MVGVKGKFVMKKLFLWLMCFVLITASVACFAFADTGPKQSIDVSFENMKDEKCFGTLLSKNSSSGPKSVYDGIYSDYGHYSDIISKEVWEKFINYSDKDGYYFLQFIDRCDDDNTLIWHYYPPNDFKILLYYPETDTFVSSGEYSVYAFDSYYTVDMSKVNIEAVATNSENTEFTAVESYNYAHEITAFAARLLLTLLIELLIALAFGFRSRKPLLLITAVNIITQIVLNLILNSLYFDKQPQSLFMLYIFAELIVLLIEAVIYSFALPKLSDRKYKITRVIDYAVIANIASLIIGYGLSFWLYSIF